MAADGQFGITLWSTEVFALAEFLQKVAGLEIEQRHPGFAALRAEPVTVDDESRTAVIRGSTPSRGRRCARIGAELRFRVASSQAFAAARKLGASRSRRSDRRRWSAG
jgi:hypothetical protein